MKLISVILILALSGSCSGGHEETVDPDEQTAIQTDVTVKPDTPESDSTFVGELIFGRYCGECGSNCAPMFRLINSGNTNTLWADYEDNYFKGANKLEFDTDLSGREKIDMAFEIMHKLPPTLVGYRGSGRRFGCPDCHDGCGIYIEFIEEPGGETKRFKLDWVPSDTVPREITDYAQFVDSKIIEIMR